MKILFLDIDGVLNSAKTFKQNRGDDSEGFFLVDPYMALLLHRIIEATECEIVLSSSWRHMPEGIKMLEKKMPWLKIKDKTGNSSHGFRGLEIEQWLKENELVTKYAIVDDNSDMTYGQRHCFFQTSWQEGLTEEISNKIIKYLNS